ncbi:hypothetical protein AB0J25_15265 [Streptomyces sp. NPDC049910]|uniref:hypothetical protein n=1 Tax=Streptomyces sp. NPDC049910 TaxID=3155278 RepID=UPI003442B7AA
MGSLRNPVGPLPSSIYWRRRAVALLLLALLALLIAWAVSSGDPGAGASGDGKPGGAGPAPSITPGPSGSGTAISEQPGGRDESGDSGDSAGTGAGGSAGAGGDAGAGGGDGKNGDPAAGGAANGGGTGPAERVPAGSSLPDCAPGAVELTVRSVRSAYTPEERPRFELAVYNPSAVTCKADLGPAKAVLTVSAINDGENDKVWSSKDCPAGGGSLLLKVPAGRTVTHTVDWDRRGSAPRCATPSATAAAPGSYLLEVAFPGASVAPASFRLETD